jgi:aromatic-L-amino-acid/L-tryptophan decarboxylase
MSQNLKIQGGRSDFASMQDRDRDLLMSHLAAFWGEYREHSAHGRVVPFQSQISLSNILNEDLPQEESSAEELFSQVTRLLRDYTVKTASPMFLGYVTPPATEMGVFADALTSIANQNVSFATLSPIGTAFESTAISWLHEIVGMAGDNGGILTSGGSEANLYAMAVARRWALGSDFNTLGYAGSGKQLRIYCSDETHHSIDKAAMVLGLGSNNIVRIPVDKYHRIKLDLLVKAIRRDQDDVRYQPLMIVGNAGTRMCCAFDDLGALRSIADDTKTWLHVDAAYGGFFRLANSYPKHLNSLGDADSLIIDPHKLLFVPYDCGALLVRRRSDLSECFGGAEGEYLEPTLSEGMVNFANLGVQLGRSMRGLKVWLSLKRFGANAYGMEIDRLLSLAQTLKGILESDKDFQLLGPVEGTALCFRWRGLSAPVDRVNGLNSAVRRAVLQRGVAFVDEVSIKGKVGMRVCMTNFRTRPEHLGRLVQEIRAVAKGGH